MDYALSLPNAYQLLTGTDTNAGLVSAIVAMLESVGWTATPISGGSKLLGASPQGYTVYVSVWDNGSNVKIQLSSCSSAAVGYEHYLSAGSGLTWQMLAHPCGFAISRTDTASNTVGTCVFAGIPRVATSCGLAAAQSISEVWFSFGDGINNAFNFAANPRVGLDVGDGSNLYGNQTGCINGEVYPLSPSAFANWSEPQIVRQSSEASDAEGAYGSHPLWFDGTDLLYPALVAWGASPGAAVAVRGQVYNAAVRSSTSARDTLQSWDSMDWMSFTDSYYWGTLWLLVSNGGSTSAGAGALCNVAF